MKRTTEIILKFNIQRTLILRLKMARGGGKKKKEMINSLKTRKTGSKTPSNDMAKVNKRKLEDENLNENATIRENRKKSKVSEGNRITTARIQEDNLVIDMDVGQDTDFLNENSDEESNVVSFRNVNSTNVDNFSEEEDGELREILDKNYQIAGLVETDDERTSENEVQPSTSGNHSEQD